MHLIRSRALFFAISLALTAIAAACGETGAEDPTPVQTFKITPPSGATQAPSPAAAPTRDEPPAPPSTPGVGTLLELTGVSSVFDKEDLRAKAGEITIEFDNRDAGVVHNVHVFRGDDNDGEDVGETELETGPLKQTLTLDLEPGEYFYQCDAHPTTMSGTLIVEP